MEFVFRTPTPRSNRGGGSRNGGRKVPVRIVELLDGVSNPDVLVRCPECGEKFVGAAFSDQVCPDCEFEFAFTRPVWNSPKVEGVQYALSVPGIMKYNSCTKQTAKNEIIRAGKNNLILWLPKGMTGDDWNRIVLPSESVKTALMEHSWQQRWYNEKLGLITENYQKLPVLPLKVRRAEEKKLWNIKVRITKCIDVFELLDLIVFDKTKEFEKFEILDMGINTDVKNEYRNEVIKRMYWDSVEREALEEEASELIEKFKAGKTLYENGSVREKTDTQIVAHLMKELGIERLTGETILAKYERGEEMGGGFLNMSGEEFEVWYEKHLKEINKEPVEVSTGSE